MREVGLKKGGHDTRRGKKKAGMYLIVGGENIIK